ncbi:iron-containing alcohol dehydrogenase [Butyricicoccus faecihominis]|uniref:iron-containing alcohol dehydrogenase n=1 Tax=Butyricicoccaceae TaxID=3085642 RepID=UPI0024789E35|nr:MULTISPECIES: iron-containing alcohol dehydrogenase [Butyricicoccaceae]MCQ5131398.1 iron-containing alcohol dehydrogenase [Butyricicoccus faecihominis]WNX84503.1 iron-containing alcohol dehydrogenase [Agathobaculum sp. NTUH-O15-33]
MKCFDTYFPTKLIFGAGTIARLGETAKAYGKKAMIVTTGDDMKNFGILDKATASLESAGVAYTVFSGVEPNPKDHNVDEGVLLFAREGCDMTIGLGGGSAMDGAKAISMISRNGGVVMDYMPGQARAAEQLTETNPCICVTTTAGTGSEATYFSVITNTKTHEKPGLGCPCMMPVASIIDPELMLSLPRGVTAQTGVDVFFHAMEAYLSTVATPYTEMVSLEAMRLTAQYLPRVLDHPDDLEARGKMAWANTLGGMAIVLAATCGLHAMGHSISGVTDIPHGRALATAAVAFMDYTWDADPERYATVARILGADPALPDEQAASECGKLMERFLKNSGMQTRLTELNVREDQIEEIADVTCSAMAFCMGVTLKKLERADIVEMLHMSL